MVATYKAAMQCMVHVLGVKQLQLKYFIMKMDIGCYVWQNDFEIYSHPVS